jgi:aminomethyltransferase
LGWITKFTKVYELGELERQKEEGVTRKLVAFEMQAVPRHDYEIVDGTGAVIGIVTSGTMSPSMNKGMDWVMLQSLTAQWIAIFIFV